MIISAVYIYLVYLQVIHIRNIPNEVTEAEIIHLGIPFGRVTNVLVLKGKNQVSTPVSCHHNLLSSTLLWKGYFFCTCKCLEF